MLNIKNIQLNELFFYLLISAIVILIVIEFTCENSTEYFKTGRALNSEEALIEEKLFKSEMKSSCKNIKPEINRINYYVLR